MRAEEEGALALNVDHKESGFAYHFPQVTPNC